MDLVNLKQTGTGWEFVTEADLEDFVWANLKQLLGLTPLKRQYFVNGQYCDILALRENQQLVVLELKNVEDRYIVQQLTRYYHALQEEKPFADEVDYQKPIELIAITPNFHRDNFTDRIYNHLAIRFFEFSVLVHGSSYFLELKDLDNQRLETIEIPYQQHHINEDIPPPPRALINRLAKCEKSSEKEKEAVFKIRRKILSFDKRMQENVNGNVIEYGKGKNNKCAEFYFCNPGSPYYGKPNLFLRLPDPEPWHKQTTMRMYILASEDWNKFTGMINYPRAFMSGKIKRSELYNYPVFIDSIKRHKRSYPSEDRANICYQSYEKLIKSKTNSLDLLVDIALETWLKRL